MRDPDLFGNHQLWIKCCLHDFLECFDTPDHHVELLALADTPPLAQPQCLAPHMSITSLTVTQFTLESDDAPGDAQKSSESVGGFGADRIK
ncbi:hypothetical protein B9M83_16960 [Mycobacteroides abscessus]|nr:hypothetical protein B9M83_16960 [Mycobacteroides abscessus]